MRRPALLAVALLVVLAGCTGTTPPGESPETTQPTTAAATTTATPTTTAEPLAPGVTAAGVENASALVDAHVAALNASGYATRVRVAVAVRFGESNGTFGSETDTAVRATPGMATASRRMTHVERDGSHARTSTHETWSNGTVGLLRVAQGDRTAYERLDPAGPGGTAERRQRLAHAVTLQDFLARGDYEVAATTMASDSTRLTLVAEGPADDAGNVTDFSATAVVDGDGRIHRLNATATGPAGDHEQTTTVEYRLVEVGVERVERPAWVDEALGEDGTG